MTTITARKMIPPFAEVSAAVAPARPADGLTVGQGVRTCPFEMAPNADPFVEPTEPTAAEAISAIADELGVFEDWMERYHYIIDLGRKLPPFPPAWQDEAHQVQGCQSVVWVEATVRGHQFYFAGASDAAIVSGLVFLVLRVYSGRSPAEILATEPQFLRDLGLIEALSTSRGNGIAAMARRIRDFAAVPVA